MEKNMTIQTGVREDSGMEFTELVGRLGAWISEPVRLLGKYYSSVLERKLSMRQTWRLIEAQLAFIACMLPADISLGARLIAVSWLVSAVLRCRRALKD